ncbi:MAG: class I SAM-dependent methyltransferase [Anaerolineaceae bacterium]|nr:class I SAM-dependent methyltransferase [Anaerolineaceae bacterium]
MTNNRRIDIRKFNADGWDNHVDNQIEWTVPVSPEEIAEARKGNWSILLTSVKKVPKEWFPPIEGADVLCLASGGGQQGPIFAAAGANVTVLDNSPRQLAQDRLVAEREGLAIHLIQGDMRDLSAFEDECFDLVYHPISNCYVPEVQPIWDEAFRVLRPGGVLLAGFVQPFQYIFDFNLWDEGRLKVVHKLPYNDLEDATDEELAKYVEEKTPLEFSHSLEELIGGQMKAGFILTGYYDDNQPGDILSDYIPVYGATRAIKPA